MTRHTTHKLAFLALLLILMAPLAACGEPTNPQVENAATAAPATAQPTEAETAPDATAAVSVPSDSAGAGIVAIDPATAETDALGLPVGFTQDGHPYRGNPNAKVVIQEFSDYQCPFCARFFQQTMPGLNENQLASGDALLVFYDFPLTSIHPQADDAANAARCAGAQGAANYWAMHDALFLNPQEWSNNDPNAVFIRYGQEIGLDAEAFGSCVNSGAYAEAVDADLDAGRTRNVTGTPTFFINNQILVGAQPLPVFNDAIAAVQQGETIASAAPSGQPQPPAQPAVAPTPATVSEEYGVVLGEANAPITIVEFSDYQCPFCQRHASQTMPRLLSEMIETGRVRYVFKDLPLDNIHPDAREGAVAAYCAGEQNAYWEMHDALFANQGEWAGQGAGTAAIFERYAGELDLNTGEFATCLGSGRYDARIQANVDEASALGIRGTPYFYVNGYPISGAQPYELFEYAVQLAEEGTLAEAYVRESEPQPTPAPSGPVEVPIGDAFVMGDENAPVTIVEYTDFQCPFCSRHFNETYPQLMEQYVETGLVRYVIKDFPLTRIHPQAMAAHEAARCAGDQDAYLAMHDLLFARQAEWNDQATAADIFAGYAAELSLDMTAYNECISSHKYQAAIQATLTEGAQLGVTGTPAFFINGNLLAGAYPFSAFQQLIDAATAN